MVYSYRQWTKEEFDNAIQKLNTGEDTFIHFELGTGEHFLAVKLAMWAGQHGFEAEYNETCKNLIVHIPDRVLLKRYYNPDFYNGKLFERTGESETIRRNIMGADESWYDPYYAISKTFTEKETDDMSDNELKNLIKLSEAITEALY